MGRFRRRAPGGVVRSSPSDLSPPLLRSWCGLIGIAAAILAVFGWFDVANIQYSECACQVFMQLFLQLFFIWLWIRGMKNVNFTFFLVSCFLVGFNRRPPDARACGFGFPETPAVSPVTINRRLSDALTSGGPYGTISVFRL